MIGFLIHFEAQRRGPLNKEQNIGIIVVPNVSSIERFHRNVNASVHTCIILAPAWSQLMEITRRYYWSLHSSNRLQHESKWIEITKGYKRLQEITRN